MKFDSTTSSSKKFPVVFSITNFFYTVGVCVQSASKIFSPKTFSNQLRRVLAPSWYTNKKRQNSKIKILYIFQKVKRHVWGWKQRPLEGQAHSLPALQVHDPSRGHGWIWITPEEEVCPWTWKAPRWRPVPTQWTGWIWAAPQGATAPTPTIQKTRAQVRNSSPNKPCLHLWLVL